MRERRERYIRNAAFFRLGSLTPRSPFDVRHLRYALSFSHSFCYAVVAAHLSPSRYSCQLPPPPLPSSLPPLSARATALLCEVLIFQTSPCHPLLLPHLHPYSSDLFLSLSFSASLTSNNPIPRHSSRRSQCRDYNIIWRLCKGWVLSRPDIVVSGRRYTSVAIISW